MPLSLSPAEGERESPARDSRLAQESHGVERSAAETNSPSDSVRLPEGARIVVDFGKLPADQWFTDGVGFGLRPTRAGELLPVAPHATNAAALRLATRPAAQFDSDWRDLDLSPGVEREPTLFGK